MPSPAVRAHRVFLAVLAAMAILIGLIPAVLIPDHGLPVTATATHRRPDDGDDADDDSDDSESDDTDDTSDDDSDSDDSDDDEVDEDKLPDNVKAILKKNRDELKQAKRELRQAKRSAKPAAKPKPKAKPKAADDDDEARRAADERVTNATVKLQRANLITALQDGKHGIADAKLAAAVALSDKLAEFDDDDELIDVDDLVTELIERHPSLKGAKPKPKAPNVDSGDKKSQKAPKLTADELAAAKASGMTPEEYANYKSPQPKLPARKST